MPFQGKSMRIGLRASVLGTIGCSQWIILALVSAPPGCGASLAQLSAWRPPWQEAGATYMAPHRGFRGLPAMTVKLLK